MNTKDKSLTPQDKSRHINNNIRTNQKQQQWKQIKQIKNTQDKSRTFKTIHEQ